MLQRGVHFFRLCVSLSFITETCTWLPSRASMVLDTTMSFKASAEYRFCHYSEHTILKVTFPGPNKWQHSSLMNQKRVTITRSPHRTNKIRASGFQKPRCDTPAFLQLCLLPSQTQLNITTYAILLIDPSLRLRYTPSISTTPHLQGRLKGPLWNSTSWKTVHPQTNDILQQIFMLPYDVCFLTTEPDTDGIHLPWHPKNESRIKIKHITTACMPP